MKNNRKRNMLLLPVFVFILVCGLITIGKTTVVHADTNSNSDGFIIETEKVEGVMEPLEVVVGEVQIFTGKIYGLTLTKILNPGNGQEPVVIKIKSEGPIPVTNLHASTVNGTIPNIGGLCTPSVVGYLCLSDVSMTVTKQTADKLTLPNATVTTCFQSQCDSVPNVEPMSEEKLQKLLGELEEQQGAATGTQDDLDAVKKQLEKVKDLINEANKQYEKVISNGQPEKLQKSIEELTGLLDSITQDQLTGKTEEIGEKYNIVSQTNSGFTTTLENAVQKFKALEENIQNKKDSLVDLKTEEKEQATTDTRAEVYKTLMEKADQQEKEKQVKDQKVAPDEKNDPEAMLKELQAMEDEMKPMGKELDELKAKKAALDKKIATISSNLKEIKTTIVEGREQYSEPILKQLLENLVMIDIPLDLEGILEKDSNKDENANTKQENVKADNSQKQTGNDSTDEGADQTESKNNETDKDKTNASDGKTNADNTQDNKADETKPQPSNDDSDEPATTNDQADKSKEETNDDTSQDTTDSDEDTNGGLLGDIGDTLTDLLFNSS